MIKNRKGITLVALVVTIVVLLILAGITISMLFSENGIVKKAQEAADATKNAQDDTTNGLQNLADQMNETLGGNGSSSTSTGPWMDNGDGTFTGSNGTTITIGDYVDYSKVVASLTGTYTSYSSINGKSDQTCTASEYTGGWRILGVENGQLLIMSEQNIPVVMNDTEQTYYYLQGKSTHVNGIKELNAISAIYAHGTYGTGARSITVEDVDSITGYNPNNVGVKDPEKTGSGTKYGAGAINEYGNTVTYYWQGTDYPYYSCSNGLTGSLRNGHGSWRI